MPGPLALVLVELAIFGFFVAFMKSDSMYVLVSLILLAGAGLYGFRRHHTLRETIAGAFSTHRWLSYLVFFGCIFSIPFIFRDSAYLIHICVMAALYSIIAMGLNFTLGSANMTHFASSAFFGIGAYAAALLSIHLHTGFWMNIFLASACTAVFGFLQAIPILKTKTYYLALVTMAFGLIFYQFVITVHFTGGPAGLLGIPYPKVFGLELVNPLHIFGVELPFQSNFLYLVVIFAFLAMVCARRIHNSWIGMTWNYIREDEIAAKCQGINVSGAKLLAFTFDAAFAGFAGTFYAHYISYIGPPNADIMISVMVVIMVILGGMDNVTGVILGAVLLTVLPEKFRVFQQFRLTIYGVIVLAMLILRPNGLLPKRVRTHQRA
ncbi:MAG: branched-chain amino acid ABC transporter permease [Deltaproteobacteria bacterium]|nr:branched-chain amino acid ABC transporter permease [Deltaproteobacteria bacterium]MBW2122575.1 branched-chain amino acid ABC transporter permease [Deltaproteobacteria bacterium]